jgi:two-component sensor histidine kinase
VRWSLDRDPGGSPAVVKLAWRESGGPPVAPPTRRGFGSRLIERSTSELEAEMQFEFDPAGVRYSVAIPLTPANAPSF